MNKKKEIALVGLGKLAKNIEKKRTGKNEKKKLLQHMFLLAYINIIVVCNHRAKKMDFQLALPATSLRVLTLFNIEQIH